MKMVTQVLKKEAGNMLPRPVRTMHRRGILRIALVLVTALILLCVRLGDLMLAKSEHYKELAYDLHTRERQLKAMRGEIQDRMVRCLQQTAQSVQFLLFTVRLRMLMKLCRRCQKH